jgi:aminopeptidase N
MSTLFGLTSVNESFERAVFFFTDDSYRQLKGNVAQAVPSAAADAWKDLRSKLRHRETQPRSTLEALLTGEDMDNVDADVLGDLYNPRRGGAFSAYIRGAKYGDLRFHLRPRGAIPGIGSPEEVALVNLNLGKDDEGIWYLAHQSEEYADGRAKSSENKWAVDVDQYRITTEIGGNEHLNATTVVSFKALAEGERILKFGLLPNLRVSSVMLGGASIPFIQEKRDDDGSFYAVLPEGIVRDKTYELTIAYAGDKVIENAGGGNFSVQARTSWYPVLNTFADQAKFDLTFRAPRQFTLVSIGKLVSEKRDGNVNVTQWVSEVPLAIAGFNYGQFKKKVKKNDALSYELETYAASELPDNLRPIQDALAISPTRMSEQALGEADAAMQVFTQWFGKAPYGRIAMTQQPALSYGQSWPGLVYLPLFAYIDATQRYRLFGGIEASLNEFLDVVAPHEVAHQWWGHMVGWSSYRDQWLSEGFAHFSAGVYLQQTQPKPEKYNLFLDHLRDDILAKNSYGFAPNDAGPLSMGMRLSTQRTGNAYNDLLYPKGSYVLHMLRMLMWDSQTGDQKFQAMMKDFVATHLFKTASTEDFQATVEKHMLPTMNLTGDNRMNWFFDEWVRGTDVPRYKFDYQMADAGGGKMRLTMTLAQSNVSDNFQMPMPVYLDLDGRTVRLGVIIVKGNNTRTLNVEVPVKPRKLMINANYDVLAYEQ